MLSGPPVVIGGRLYVQSESGQLAVFEVQPPEEPKATKRKDTGGDS
jgi:hypothetical protein